MVLDRLHNANIDCNNKTKLLKTPRYHQISNTSGYITTYIKLGNSYNSKK